MRIFYCSYTTFFQGVFSVADHNRCRNLDGGFIVDSMSFTSKHLILRGKQTTSTPFNLSTYDMDTGILVSRKQTECQHSLPHGSLTTVGAKAGITDEILTEGCLDQECEVIRGYDVTLDEAYIVLCKC